MKNLLALLVFGALSLHEAQAQGSSSFKAITEALGATFHDEITARQARLGFTLVDARRAPHAMARKVSERDWQIEMDQSMHDLTALNPATMALILCHEVGHFLGGAPYVVGRPLTAAVTSRAPKKMSCEGQADYFAATSCFHRIVKSVPALEAAPEVSLDHDLARQCESAYAHPRDQKICRIGLRASSELATIYATTLRAMDMPSSFVERFSHEVTDRTLNYVGEYPDLSCRYQTMAHGMLCNETVEGECRNSAWVRPSCWFLP